VEGLHGLQGFGAKFGLKSFFGAVTERDINSWRSKKDRVVQSLGGPRRAKSEGSGPRK
jgi:hypothetical protein